MRRFAVTREVIEYIEVEAEDDFAADDVSSESPIDNWDRDIKSTGVEDITGDGFSMEDGILVAR